MLQTTLTVVQVFSAIAIVALVLIQRGKGADAGAGFGAGASGTMFGARGATAVFAAIFMLNSLLLTYAFKQNLQQDSILDAVPVPAAPVPGSTGAGEIGAGAPLTMDAPVPAPIEGQQGVPVVSPPPAESQSQP